MIGRSLNEAMSLMICSVKAPATAATPETQSKVVVTTTFRLQRCTFRNGWRMRDALDEKRGNFNILHIPILSVQTELLFRR